MARIARVVVPGIPHHITQRGNRRMETFFTEADYREGHEGQNRGQTTVSMAFKRRVLFINRGLSPIFATQEHLQGT